jgi:PAS domain S-box-containing protein
MSSAAVPETQFAEPLEALRVILPTQTFSEEELRELLPMCELKVLPAEHTLIKEGEPSDNRVYFLLSGSVSVSIQGRFILSLHNRGESIGEMGLISSAPRSATVCTDKPSQFLVINATMPEGPLGPDDYKLRYSLSRIFNSILTEKLRTTSDRARLYEDMLDRSERVEQQRRSLEQEIAAYLQQISLYSHLVNGANDAILITDPEGRILNANRALMRSFGVETDTVIGVQVDILLAMPNGEPGNWESISREARGGGWHGEVVVYHPSLGAIPADCSIFFVHDSEGALLAYSVILRDIRERKALEQETQRQAAELERAYGQLRELDRAKSNFLNLISHELRTPITSILAYSELLKTEGMVEPEERQSFVEVIHKETEKLSEMVKKVLAISKMESGQMLFNFTEQDLEQLVRHAAAMLRSQAEVKQVTLSVSVPNPLAPVVFDEENLREAVAQLLDNAIKYTDGGSIEVEVTQRDGTSLIRIDDTGKGIEGLNIDDLLDNFGRGDPVNVGPHGLGLGLPLCYLIVKAHSGTLSLQSRAGHGTEAVFALPMQPIGAPLND